MLKPVLAFAAVGFVGVVLWKVVLLPLFAGLLGFVLKVALVVAAALAIMWLLRKKDSGKRDAEARAD